MSKPKKKSPAASQLSKQERDRTKQDKQKQTNRMFVIGTIAFVVIIFVVLFMMASKDSSSTTTAAEPTSFNYSELPRLGKEDAPVKIVEFGDFKCPACAQFTGLIKPQIVKELVEPGKASFYFVNMAFIGPDSETASLAALSIYHQNADEFWKFFDAVYANQGDENAKWATEDYLVGLAEKEKLNIDLELLRKDIKERTYYDELQRDIKTASGAGVNNTPTIFINGVKSAEPFNFDAISAEVNAAAKAAEAK
ncbi:thioredoxin domain-containing protein [Bacillus sp. FJAT-27264]|uniref:DsbA family protein n=1 Tax=Paenibacillus sp. (strain DSM 101736 / FJAT-27264) TaxID=1850362 RepID=UPI0009F5AD77|nr:thioredoxin domain-containing protein [Bacillus sp. FJAT-27264]